jgi:hypothetical protein
MTLGKPFTVPACVIGADGIAGEPTCWFEPKFSLMGRQVLLGANNAPTWVKPTDHDQTPRGAAAAIDVEVINGNLETVHIPTVGLQFQELVIAALKKKFGSPLTAETTIKQNAFGARVQVATLSWQLSGVKILFDGGDLDHGMIMLSTDKSQYLKRAVARQKGKF